MGWIQAGISAIENGWNWITNAIGANTCPSPNTFYQGKCMTPEEYAQATCTSPNQWDPSTGTCLTPAEAQALQAAQNGIGANSTTWIIIAIAGVALIALLLLKK